MNAKLSLPCALRKLRGKPDHAKNCACAAANFDPMDRLRALSAAADPIGLHFAGGEIRPTANPEAYAVAVRLPEAGGF